MTNEDQWSVLVFIAVAAAWVRADSGYDHFRYDGIGRRSHVRWQFRFAPGSFSVEHFRGTFDTDEMFAEWRTRWDAREKVVDTTTNA